MSGSPRSRVSPRSPRLQFVQLGGEQDSDGHLRGQPLLHRRAADTLGAHRRLGLRRRLRGLRRSRFGVVELSRGVRLRLELRQERIRLGALRTDTDTDTDRGSEKGGRGVFVFLCEEK